MQPAPFHSDPDPSPPDPAGDRPTYGELIGLTRGRVDTAVAVSCGRQPDAETARRELDGYLGFLHTAGVHLGLLAGATGTSSPGVRRLAGRLDGLAPSPAEDTRWHHAALALGAAHDVVASHLDARFLPLTVDGRDLLPGPAGLIATQRTVELVLGVTEPARALMYQGARAQRHHDEKPISITDFQRIRSTNDAVQIYGSAAMWQLNASLEDMTGPTLDDLRTPTRVASRSFGSSLAALRALREVSFAQTRGRASASPASLRDLALLGAKVTDPTLAIGPVGLSGLALVRQAHRADHLTAAYIAWTAASAELTTTIQGLTKAPASYGAAIRALLDESQLSPQVRRAVTEALPRLGQDAATTIRRLADSGTLVSSQRVPCQLRNQWRPLTAAQTVALSQRFEAAAAHTTRALAATPRPEAQHQRSAAETPAPPAVRRELTIGGRP